MKMNRFAAVALMAALSLAITAGATRAEPDQEVIFADAGRYTVKIRTYVDFSFIEDSGGSFTGSGFVVDRERGWILTNAHVASWSPSLVEVAFRGGRYIEARKHYVDAHLDLAILAVPPARIPADTPVPELECGDTPAVGHSVGAFGHPWDLDFTGTRGIISGLDYNGTEWLQTDAPINAGNSGGPLISLESGRVIGINTATYEEAEGLNFAIAAKYVCTILDLLAADRDPSAPFLPVIFADDMDGNNQLTVAAVYGDPAELPLRVGDLVLGTAGGRGDLENQTQLIDALRGGLANARLQILRRGKRIELDVRLSAAPDPMARSGIYFSGMLIGPTTFRDEAEINLGNPMMIHGIDSASYSEMAGAAAWDFIVSIDGTEFDDMEVLYEYLLGAERDEHEITVITRSIGEDQSQYYQYRKFLLPVVDLRIIGQSRF